MREFPFFASVLRHHRRRDESIRVIQRRFRRYSRFGHARRGAPMVHRFTDAWRYAHIRREWRLEPSSWLMCSASMYEAILTEAVAGTWGPACHIR